LRLHEKKRLSNFRIFGLDRIATTGADCLLPLGAPIDQHEYDEAKHGPRPPAVPLTFPCFREVVAIVGIDPAASLDLPAALGESTLLLDGPAGAPAAATRRSGGTAMQRLRKLWPGG
jgi:hypothetical protein